MSVFFMFWLGWLDWFFWLRVMNGGLLIVAIAGLAGCCEKPITTPQLRTDILNWTGKPITINHIKLEFGEPVDVQLLYTGNCREGSPHGAVALTGIYHDVEKIDFETPIQIPAGNQICVDLLGKGAR